VFYTALLTFQWVLLGLGIVGLPVGWWYYGVEVGLMSVMISLLALMNLKLDVVSLAR